MRGYLIIISLLFLQSCFLKKLSDSETAHNKDVTVYNKKKVFAGYTLIAPFTSKNFYLINNGGFVVKKWEAMGLPGAETALLPDGRILRAEKIENTAFPTAGSTGGMIHIYNWDNSQDWEYKISSENELQHHDALQLPNGNFLFTVWEKKNKTFLIENGKELNGREAELKELWMDKIIEVKQTGKNSGEIVWEWKLWDHLIQDKDSIKTGFKNVAANPGKIDINYNFIKQGNPSSFSHFNGIAYVKEMDILIVSVRNFNELWFIDHSTTTKEAATSTGGKSNKGGDLLYRWGNPYAHQNGSYANRKLFGQHHPTYIQHLPNHGGNVMVFNNLQMDSLSVEFSSVSEINIPFNNGDFLSISGKNILPKDLSWDLKPPDFASKNISSAQRLPNGNTLTCLGAGGTVFEFTHHGDLVWKYQIPITMSSLFKTIRYANNYPAFKGKRIKVTKEIVN